MNGPFIAIDWGTTNRRVYRIDERGRIEASVRDELGILAMTRDDYQAEVQSIRARYGDLPVICGGMVGSRQGWIETAYVACPARLADLAANAHWVQPRRTAVLPGVRTSGNQRADVMRGEEVQFLGVTLNDPSGQGVRLCQPGTHCKWAVVVGDGLRDFTTTMTGEMFGMLRDHSLLSAQLAGQVAPGPAFVEGVSEGSRRDLSASLFAIRASALLDLRPDTESAAYASGLLIGADVMARDIRDSEIHVLADPMLGQLYQVAIETLGGTAQLHDSNAAFATGIAALWALMK